MMTNPIIHPIEQRTVDGGATITAFGDRALESTARQIRRDFVELVHNLTALTDTGLAHVAVFAHDEFRVAIEGQDGIDRGLEAGAHFLIPAGRDLELDLGFGELGAEAIDLGFLALEFVVGVI